MTLNPGRQAVCGSKAIVMITQSEFFSSTVKGIRQQLVSLSPEVPPKRRINKARDVTKSLSHFDMPGSLS